MATPLQRFQKTPMPTKPKAGRPTYVATDKDKNIVRMLTGFGIDQIKICEALDISGPTLRKHFKKEIRVGAAQVETQLIAWALEVSHGNKSRAAELLRIKRSTLGDRIRRLGLDGRRADPARPAADAARP